MDVLDRADLPFPHSLPEFQRLFPDDAACAAYLEQARWGDGVACPHCGTAGEPCHFENRPGVLRCRKCRQNTGLTVGTVTVSRVHREVAPHGSRRVAPLVGLRRRSAATAACHGSSAAPSSVPGRAAADPGFRLAIPRGPASVAYGPRPSPCGASQDQASRARQPPPQPGRRHPHQSRPAPARYGRPSILSELAQIASVQTCIAVLPG